MVSAKLQAAAWITAPMAARLLGCSAIRVHTLRKRGVLQRTREYQGHTLFDRGEVEAVRAERISTRVNGEVPPDPGPGEKFPIRVCARDYESNESLCVVDVEPAAGWVGTPASDGAPGVSAMVLLTRAETLNRIPHPRLVYGVLGEHDFYPVADVDMLAEMWVSGQINDLLTCSPDDPDEVEPEPPEVTMTQQKKDPPALAKAAQNLPAPPEGKASTKSGEVTPEETAWRMLVDGLAQPSFAALLAAVERRRERKEAPERWDDFLGWLVAKWDDPGADIPATLCQTLALLDARQEAVAVGLRDDILLLRDVLGDQWIVLARAVGSTLVKHGAPKPGVPKTGKVGA